jgi:hypothetical protein
VSGYGSRRASKKAKKAALCRCFAANAAGNIENRTLPKQEIKELKSKKEY